MFKKMMMTEYFSWLVKKGSMALVLRLLGAAAGFLLHLFIARSYGAAGTGLYSLSLTVIGIAMIFATSGITRALLKMLSANISIERWDIARTIYAAAMKRALLTSVVVIAILMLLIPFLTKTVFRRTELDVFLYWMSLAIYPQILILLFIQCLRSYSNIALVMIIRNIETPLLQIMFLSVFAVYLGKSGIPVSYFTASVITSMTGWLLWKRALAGKPPGDDQHAPSTQKVAEFHSSSNTFIWLDLINTVIRSAPILILGIWVDSKQLGIFAIATRILALTGFTLDVMNVIVGSRFAAFYERGELEKLSRFMGQTVNILLLTSVPIFLVLLAAPEWVLGMFGPEFITGKTVLLVLSAGEFIGIVCGPVGLLLTMTGHEKRVRRVTLFTAALLLILCLALIPFFGITGAAISVSLAIAARNIANVITVKVHLGIKLRSLT